MNYYTRKIDINISKILLILEKNIKTKKEYKL